MQATAGWGYTSGAGDEASARAANAAVGNDATAAVLENIGGMQITALADSVVALTGAEAPPGSATAAFRWRCP